VRRLVVLAAWLVACTPTAKTSCEPPASQVYVLASARWKPAYEGGVLRGIDLSDVVQGSFLACLGLRDGDRLVAIDGERIAGPSFFEKFGKRRAFSLRVENASGGAREIVNH